MPDSFDRKEFKFFISRAEQVEYSETTLKGVIKSLPDRFNMPKEEFFQPAGRKTASGIIFVIHARGNYGLMNTKSVIDETARVSSTFYSGKTPTSVREDEWRVTKKNK